MVMAEPPEVIIIGSSEDEEDDVVYLGTRATCVVKREKTEPSNKENVSIFIENSPDRKRVKPSFKMSMTKLDLLKTSMRKSRKSNHSSSKIPARNEFKISKVRLKKLEAHLKIVLDKSAPKSLCSDLNIQGKMISKTKLDLLKKSVRKSMKSNHSLSKVPAQNKFKEMTQDSEDLAKPNRNLFCSPNWPILSPVQSQNHPQSHIIISPIKNKSPAITNLHTGTGSPCLSSGCTTPTNSPLKQTTIKTWLTPTKKSPQVAAVPDVAEKHVTAKRNEVVWPPSHVTLNSTEFIPKLYKQSRSFPSCYSDIIEGLQDELFLFQVVRSIQSLMSSCMPPSCDLIWILVKDVLLKSCQQRLSFATYSLLNEIHARFPARCIAMYIQWQDIKHLTKQLMSFFTTTTCTELHFLNASLALLFILNILSSEVKSTALKTRNISRLARYFSADFDSRIMKDIVAGIKPCLTKQRDTSDTSKSDKSLSAISSLGLFQDLLKFVIVSSNYKENVAERISDELMFLYMDLPSLEARILLLQTLKSHLVRSCLIEVLLKNYCRLGDKTSQGNEVHMGARKILFQVFWRCPPKRSSDYSSDRYTVEEVEEYVTLVAYLLQSYMATHTPSLQCVHGDSPLSQVNHVSKFTPEDINLFCKLKCHVSKLQKRCLDFIEGTSQRLSIRTQLMLDMMAICYDE